MRTGALLTVLALLLVLVPTAAATDPTSKTPAQIRQFYSSGAWNKAVTKQANKAKAWLAKRTSQKKAPKKPALVLDIDETSLNNYPCFVQNDGLPYNSGVNAACVTQYDAPAIKPVLSLYKRAKKLGVKVFFVTGRPEEPSLRAGTLENLRSAGYTGKIDLTMTPSGYAEESLVPYKSGARRAIERRGFKILANVGDQRSDLKGGYSERTYKLPNPIYFTP